MHKKLKRDKVYTQRLFRLRSSTVEPVLGTLINYLNMRRVNTRGIDLANKHVLMAALTYNLKKYLKFKCKVADEIAIAAQVPAIAGRIWSHFSYFYSFLSYYRNYINFIINIFTRPVLVKFA
jgi:hypothetical protein